MKRGASPEKNPRIDREEIQNAIRRVMAIHDGDEFIAQWENECLTSRIEFEDLFIMDERNLSLFMHLAKNLRVGLDLFLRVWERFKDKLSYPHMIAKTTDVIWKDVSPLMMFALTAYDDNPFFIQVWERFVDDIKLEDLIFAPLEGLFFAHSVLGSLYSVTTNFRHPNEKQKIELIINYILTQMPGSIPEVLNYSAFVKEDEGTRIEIKNLFMEKKQIIIPRNEFFKDLEEAKNFDKISDTTFDSLTRLAQAAYVAGYVNAHYDLGQLFSSKHESGKARKAYQHLSKESKYYQKICKDMAGQELVFALNSTIEYKRKKHLHYALEFAIKVEDDPTRFDLIEKIASLYIFNKPKEGQDEIIQADWMIVMNEETGLAWCLDRLKDLETRENLKQEQKKLEAELAELNAATQNQQKKIRHMFTR